MKLGVNIDHIATLRQLRRGNDPEPVFAALVCESAGADSIVMHLREDRRHVNERDLLIVKQVLRTRLNLEMSVSEEIVKFACKLKPNQATLVPEKRMELTTEGGLDVIANFKKIQQVTDKLTDSGVAVSLFLDPDKAQIDNAKRIGIKMVELHTGSYANATTSDKRKKCLQELKDAAYYAKNSGLHVFAGHGLDYFNVDKIVGIDPLEELNIGYSIVCRAVVVGLEQAVRQMKVLISKSTCGYSGL